jgi:hypothetical protein
MTLTINKETAHVLINVSAHLLNRVGVMNSKGIYEIDPEKLALSGMTLKQAHGLIRVYKKIYKELKVK